MYDLFPNWMSKVAGEGSSTRVKDRWTAVEQTAKALTAQQVVEAVAHAFGYGTAMTDLIRVQAREADTTYVTEDDALEVQILTAATIAHLLSGNSRQKHVAVLAVLSTTFGRKVPEFMGRDLLALAAQQLQEVAETRRANAAVPAWNTKPLIDTITKAIPSPEAAITGAAVLSALTTVIEQVRAQTASCAGAVNSAGTLQKESAALAFAIVSEYSDVAEKLVAEASLGDAAFAVGRDLYEITAIAPAIPAYEAVVRCLLRPAKTAKKTHALEALVDTLSDKVRLQCIDKKKLSPLAAPLQYCLEKKGEASGGDWRPAFTQGTRLKADLNVTLAQVAQQVYLERCLLWALGAA